MASSRWKRFAFFDRSTLSLPSQVQEDLTSAADASRRLSTDRMSMVVTTAALPGQTSTPETQEESVSAMWSSLTACTAPILDQTQSSAATLHMPSQHQSLILPPPPSSVSSTDGLALLFLASPESSLVHCVDVTVRCQGIVGQDDLDGWRGYYAPMLGRQDTILGVATCRGSSPQNQLHVACISRNNLVLNIDPHLYLSCRLPLVVPERPIRSLQLASPWNESQYGYACAIDLELNRIAVGTDTGTVLIFNYNCNTNSKTGPALLLSMVISPPVATAMVTTVKLTGNSAVFVTYSGSSRGGSGVCCYELGSSNSPTPATAPLARHDLDGRQVPWSSLCDAVRPSKGNSLQYMVARPDGLYTYSHTQKVGVSPIDGTKNAICAIPPPPTRATLPVGESGSSYALVASTDDKSGRDAVDIYDSINKLVAFHVLLSPGHKALRAVGITTQATRTNDGSMREGRSTAIVMTSGGQIVTLIEKVTPEKVSLLVQKNLYSAAITMAYADPSFQPADITALYRRHAEHLYRKGDFAAAMDQYIYTIGSLESSHVIFRYLDAPKIPLLVKYLEELRSRDIATPVHNELLRTCYLKLNDNEAAEKIMATPTGSTDTASCASIVSSMAHRPKDALATVCSFEAPQAAEALVVHGAALARALPRETAGVVVALCVGTYSPRALADLTSKTSGEVTKMLEYATHDRPKTCDPYPVHLFASAFVENPKMLRLILAHCNRNKCPLTPSLRRTLLELTLEDWNHAKRTGDTEAEKLRRKEAIAALTDANCRNIGDYDALVIVQLAGFAEGELLLYERLQMTPMLLARYAQDGGDRARRHMLAMCRTDPEVLADVLGHFVAIASERIDHDGTADDASTNSEEDEILEDIREALSLAQAQGVLPPVRIARILAGEGVGQFSTENKRNEAQKQRTVPLSVALDYVGAILDDSRKEISRLKSEVEEYNQLCNSMEAEVNTLLSGTVHPPTNQDGSNKQNLSSRMNIERLYALHRSSLEDGSKTENKSDQSREAFWREMNQSEDRFETLARFFAKGVIQ